MTPRLTVLDVGHGNCAVLEHGGHVGVFDAGSRGCLARFLGQRGIRRIDTLILSHADADHIGGAVSLLNERHIAVGKVRTNPDALKESNLWDALSFMLEERSLDPNEPLDDAVGIQRSNTAAYDVGDVHVEIVAPSSYLARKAVGGRDSEGRKISANSLSVVVRLHHNGRPMVLLPGDMDEVSLDDMKRLNADLHAQVLVFPHHGGRGRGNVNMFTERLLLAVQPHLIVFSNGRGIHHTPRPEIIETIRRIVPQARVACTQLSEHCAPELSPRRATHLSVIHARGKEEGRCCAGSLELDFGMALLVNPTAEHHGRFIDALQAPLCRRGLATPH